MAPLSLAEVGRREVVVGLLARARLCRLVVQSQVRHQLERVVELGGQLAVEQPGLRCDIQPTPRRQGG